MPNVSKTDDRYYFRKMVNGKRTRIPIGKDLAEAERLSERLEQQCSLEKQERRSAHIINLTEGAYRAPRILLWDIETAPIIRYSWTLFEKSPASPNMIIRDWWMICAAWKWLGEDEVHTTSVMKDAAQFKEDHSNDRRCIEDLYKAILDADILVHQNGDKFDVKRLNTRAWKYGMDPLPPIPTIDTLKVARNKFALSSNKLDWMGEFLGVGNKIKTDFELWSRCSNGERKAIKEMIEYNQEDVRLLERVYLRQLPFIDNHPNLNLIMGTEYACPKCGSHNTATASKDKRSRVHSYQGYICLDCGGWCTDGKSKGKSVLR